LGSGVVSAMNSLSSCQIFSGERSNPQMVAYTVGS
jgi:hypothetical protein